MGTDALGHVYITGVFSRTITIGSTTVTLPTNVNSVFTARLSAATGTIESLASAFYYATSTSPGTFDYFYPQLAVTPTGEMYILNTFNQSPLFSNTTLTSRGSNDVLIAKYNAQGNFEWAQQFGGPSEENMRDGVVDAAGNLYVVGSFTGPATFGNTTLSGAGNFDGCLVKYSPQGTMQWVQSVGGPNVDGLTSVSLDTSGNPYVTGYFTGTAQFGSATLTSTGSRDIMVAAYTPQGQLRWAQQASGPGADTGTYLGIDATGEVYVHGLFTGSCNFGPLSIANSATGYESFVARLGNHTFATSARPTFSTGLYPNPATTSVHLPSVPVGNQVQLLDAVGRIARTTVVAPGGSVSLQGVTPGLYVVRATDAQGHQVSGRLVVE
ncbi:T9SS type A sorting domain-containing protein [Hymenobacter tibetensis]|uniref:T9SS type A sorting domain-containing protein n=1 Tax=Hymenobacter tibetensis TaxID=497967 RepID=A0ABY4CWD7_9BACT|nr:T9SS type A sorting domain-containing protein [Hymenobacter tibetensis]UOG74570.1 T9SS type A sorting domain-containing protein [Hymenobacter tibetensis]